jgi:RNA polymerase sigma factor for flagellar operon FliA
VRPADAPSATERDQTIVTHQRLVRIIAGRIARQFACHVDIDELVSVGMLGLIEAVDRFEPARGVPFRAFAEIRIRGAIVDAIRQRDWVPRVVRQRYALIDRTRAQLRQRLGRDATRDEMACALHLTPQAYDDLVGASVVHRLVPLDAPADASDSRSLAELVTDDRPSATDCWIDREREEALVRAIERLPHNEREVIELYYQQGLRYAEIGRRMGVCESRVSQLRGQAIGRIQKQLRGWMAS